MTTDEMKKWIDAASYEELLRKWRFEPGGSPWFAREIGIYYANRMAEMRNSKGGNDAHVAASKAIGW